MEEAKMNIKKPDIDKQDIIFGFCIICLTALFVVFEKVLI